MLNIPLTFCLSNTFSVIDSRYVLFFSLSLENSWWWWDGERDDRGSHVHPGEETADSDPRGSMEDQRPRSCQWFNPVYCGCAHGEERSEGKLNTHTFYIHTQMFIIVKNITFLHSRSVSVVCYGSSKAHFSITSLRKVTLLFLPSGPDAPGQSSSWEASAQAENYLLVSSYSQLALGSATGCGGSWWKVIFMVFGESVVLARLCLMGNDIRRMHIRKNGLI